MTRFLALAALASLAVLGAGLVVALGRMPDGAPPGAYVAMVVGLAGAVVASLAWVSAPQRPHHER